MSSLSVLLRRCTIARSRKGCANSTVPSGASRSYNQRYVPVASMTARNGCSARIVSRIACRSWQLIRRTSDELPSSFTAAITTVSRCRSIPTCHMIGLLVRGTTQASTDVIVDLEPGDFLVRGGYSISTQFSEYAIVGPNWRLEAWNKCTVQFQAEPSRGSLSRRVWDRRCLA